MIGPDPIPTGQPSALEDPYPAGEEAHAQAARRQRIGKFWQFLFLGATAFAAVVLMVLLVKIVNDAFGLVAEESRIPERELVLGYNEAQVLNAPAVTASEDDLALAQGIAADPNAIGFVPWAAYQANAGGVKLVAVDGQRPTNENVRAGEYPAARSLFIYSAGSILDAKPQVRAFLLYYLAHADEVAQETGYFAANGDALAAQAEAIAAQFDLQALPVVNPAEYEGDINITGSSTLYPMTRAVADRFVAAGFPGQINVESSGTTAGFRAFCIDNTAAVDIVDASRAILPTEYAACRNNRRSPQEFLVGQDALAVIVNAQNDFVDDVSREQLATLLTTATTWADANQGWPAEAIARYIPSADSGTMDFFVESLFPAQSLDEMPFDALVEIYTTHVSAGRCRAAEYEQRFYADRLVCDVEERFQAMCASDAPRAACTLPPRDETSVRELLQADVVQAEVKQSWNAIESVLRRDEILAYAANEYPNAQVYFKRWLTRDFITSTQSSFPDLAGIRTAILGTLWVVGIAVLVSFPLGVGAAIYLEEYANKKSRLNQIIQTNINNLAGVPSIIYGLLGLAVFVRILEPITSGALLGASDPATANGRTILSAGLTLALLGLPVIIISSQEAIRAVPNSLRQASFGLGATRWQTVWNHVLPNAIASILTGVILSMSRIIGETAPLVVVGASTFITTDPTGPFSKFTTLPSQIYQWTARPQDIFRDIAAAAIIALLVLLFLLNLTAIYLRNRYSRRMA